MQMMRKLRTFNPKLAVVLGFGIACLAFFGFLWAQAGGSVPGFTGQDKYSVSVDMPDVGNLVEFSDVQIAGVNVGKVVRIDRAGQSARVTFNLQDVAAPLHQGVTVQASEKSLAGNGYLHVVDGHGATISADDVLPSSDVKPPVTLRDVLASLDKPTRDAISGTTQSLAASTAGRQQDLGAVMSGLANLGRNGHTALDAIAGQGDDLKAMSGELTQTLAALDTGQGQIADVVSDANRLSGATAGQRPALENTMRQLPGVLSSARTGSGDISALSQSLAPVAQNLQAAAPDLRDALVELPATSTDLRGLLPSLNGTLTQAPATLNAVPKTGSEVRALIPTTTSLLRDLNPTLRYLSPYGPELAHLFVNFGAAMNYQDSNGVTALRLRTPVTLLTAKPLPLDISNTPLIKDLPLTQANAYPGPGSLDKALTPFTGTYPRVERDPK